MQGLLDGLPLVDLARRLGVRASSITTYRRRVLDKLGVASNAELIRLMGPLK
jgi:DNA-binding CsgD family transcriptional regulator